MNLRKLRARELIGETGKESRCSVVALDSVERVKGFFDSVNFVQLGVLLKPAIEQKTLAVVELEAVA